MTDIKEQARTWPADPKERAPFELGPNQTRFVEALESGRHQIGRERLTKITAGGTELDCCLGVLCKVAGLKRVYTEEDNIAGRTVRAVAYEDTSHQNGERDGGNKYYAPDLAVAFVGLRDKHGSTYGTGYGAGLAKMNDNGKDFAFIAAKIREAPQAYFDISR